MMLYLVRHGQTDWNLFKRFNGHTDAYLNQTGIAQAKRLAEDLQDICFDACFCSPQTRARQFCEMVYRDSVVFDDRLCEIDCGDFEGTEETTESMTSFWQAIQTGDRGTERLDAFIKRNCDVCDLITDKYKGRNVLMVTHAANARVIHYYFSGKPKNYDFGQRVIGKGEWIAFDFA